MPMPKSLPMRVVKPLVFLACLGPFALLIANGVGLGGSLGANPIDKITDVTGTWTLRFVLITLSVTPFRRLTGWNTIIRFRRMLGLFAFFYGSMHFLTWAVIDQGLALQFIGADIAKRPYITVGFLGFSLMIPLAITSTSGWIRRLGGKRWQTLHRAIYLTAVCGVIHYLWLVKSDINRPMTYGAILAVLLGIRVWYAWRPKPKPAATGAKDAADAGASALRTAPRSSR
jgi:methionine sulfoxide reductase heme-binding subunit